MFKQLIINFLINQGLDFLIDLIVEFIKKDGISEREKTMLDILEKLSTKYDSIEWKS